MQNNTSTPDLYCQQGVAPPDLGGAPTQHPLNPSKSAHDLDLDLERDILNSLGISTHLERWGVCENQQTADKPPAPEEPARPLQKQTLEKKSTRFIKPTIPEQAERLAHLLYDLHRQIDAHFTTSQKRIEQWAKDIEKLNRIDKRSYQDIEKVIRWIKTEGNFWAPNIISGSKLREKYPQIFLQMQQRSRSPPRGTAPNYKQQNFNADSLPELFKQSRLEKPPEETAALDGVVF